MHKIYFGEDPPYKFSKSLFLAGPSIRKEQEGTSWRKEALRILSDIGYNGVVYLPENRNGKLEPNHDDNWETRALETCDCIVMWLPCQMDTLPCLTSRLEYGRFADSRRLVLGIPEDAEQMSFIRHDAHKLKLPISETLTQTLVRALEFIGDGAERSLAERCIPLIIWNTPQWKSYYKNLLDTGNRLESAKVLYNIGSNDEIGITLIRPSIYIAAEDRIKDVETVIARADTTATCLWKETDDQDIEIVLVEEFRSACRNKAGMIFELPGGACDGDENAQEGAHREVLEETKLDMDMERLKYIGARQTYGTLLSHQAHLFSYHLNDEEMKWIKNHQEVARGVKSEGEKTFAKVVKLSDVKSGGIVDWATLGQISVAAGRV